MTRENGRQDELGIPTLRLEEDFIQHLRIPHGGGSKGWGQG
jgi:hypothetical protein